jgi:hypothetical protein
MPQRESAASNPERSAAAGIELNQLIQVATDSALRAVEARGVDAKYGFPRIWIGLWIDFARAEGIGKEVGQTGRTLQ